jgi:hypothetical protein
MKKKDTMSKPTHRPKNHRSHRDDESKEESSTSITNTATITANATSINPSLPPSLMTCIQEHSNDFANGNLELWTVRLPASLDVTCLHDVELDLSKTLVQPPQNQDPINHNNNSVDKDNNTSDDSIVGTFYSTNQLDAFVLRMGQVEETESFRILIPIPKDKDDDDSIDDDDDEEHDDTTMTTFQVSSVAFSRHVHVGAALSYIQDAPTQTPIPSKIPIHPAFRFAPPTAATAATAASTAPKSSGSLEMRHAYAPEPQKTGLKRRWTAPGMFTTAPTMALPTKTALSNNKVHAARHTHDAAHKATTSAPSVETKDEPNGKKTSRSSSSSKKKRKHHHDTEDGPVDEDDTALQRDNKESKTTKQQHDHVDHHKSHPSPMTPTKQKTKETKRRRELQFQDTNTDNNTPQIKEKDGEHVDNEHDSNGQRNAHSSSASLPRVKKEHTPTKHRPDDGDGGSVNGQSNVAISATTPPSMKKKEEGKRKHKKHATSAPRTKQEELDDHGDSKRHQQETPVQTNSTPLLKDEESETNHSHTGEKVRRNMDNAVSSPSSGKNNVAKLHREERNGEANAVAFAAFRQDHRRDENDQVNFAQTAEFPRNIKNDDGEDEELRRSNQLKANHSQETNTKKTKSRPNDDAALKTTGIKEQNLEGEDAANSPKPSATKRKHEKTEDRKEKKKKRTRGKKNEA